MYRRNEKSEEARCSKLGREWKDDKKSTGLSESLAMSSVIIQQRVFSFFFYRKFDEKEISTLWILWVFLVEEVNIKKKEKKRKRKIRRKYTKSVQQFFGLLSVSPLLKLETCGVAAWRKDKGFCTRKLKFYFEQTNCNEFSREIFFLLIKFLQRRTNVFSSWWLIRRREYELKICKRRERVWKRR